MHRDLTVGSITGTMLRLVLPMILGNLLQQFCDIASALIVGRYLGANALVAMGTAYALMTLLISILLGLSMGSGAVLSLRFGEKNSDMLKNSIFVSFVMIAAAALAVDAGVFLLIDPTMRLLCVPGELYALMREYPWVISYGILIVFLYNFFASLLYAVGNSFISLVFLGIAAVLNVILGLVLVLVFHWGVGGAVGATVTAQFVSGVGIGIYMFVKTPEPRTGKNHMRMGRRVLEEISQLSSLTCAQWSVMNSGILMVQGLVNNFGTAVMVAPAAVVKIGSLAHMSVQDLGNALSTFTIQNYGAGKRDRIKVGIKSAVTVSIPFCLFISAIVWIFTKQLMLIFVQPQETEILATGVGYLRTEGAFYWGIRCLLLLYGLYRAVRRPGMSVVLTVISLGTRVALAYALVSVPSTGVTGIWASAPIGWIPMGLAEFLHYGRVHKELQEGMPRIQSYKSQCSPCPSTLSASPDPRVPGTQEYKGRSVSEYGFFSLLT